MQRAFNLTVSRLPFRCGDLHIGFAFIAFAEFVGSDVVVFRLVQGTSPGRHPVRWRPIHADRSVAGSWLLLSASLPHGSIAERAMMGTCSSLARPFRSREMRLISCSWLLFRLSPASAHQLQVVDEDQPNVVLYSSSRRHLGRSSKIFRAAVSSMKIGALDKRSIPVCTIASSRVPRAYPLSFRARSRFRR